MATDAPMLPYPGLRPFNSRESQLFFGRDEHVFKMFSLLEEHRFLAVVGASGSGKSSLVRAGLLPRLNSDGLLNQRPGVWRFLIMLPGNSPLDALAAACHDDDPITGARLSAGELHRGDRVMTRVVLESGPRGLLRVLDDAGVSDDDNVLLVVDQFEELFRFANYDGSFDGTSKRRNESLQFVALLLETARQDERPVHVVLTMRTDFIGDCDQFDGLPQAINDGQYLVPRLTWRQLELAITGPLQIPGFESRIDRAIIDRILNAASQERDTLPLVQHALLRMWLAAGDQAAPDAGTAKSGCVMRHITEEEHYLPIGGLTHALDRHATDLYQSLSDARQDIAETLFRCLAERSEKGQWTRRLTSIREVAEIAGVGTDEVIAVVEVFRRPGVSFLVTSPEGAVTDASSIDISHESLLRQWKLLRTWMEREIEAAASYRRLIDAVNEKETAIDGVRLERALEWRNTVHPTPAWARRYDRSPAGNDSQLARCLQLIDDSLAAQEARRQALEAAERREQAHRKLVSRVIAYALAFVSVAAVVAIHQYRAASHALEDVYRLSGIQELHALEKRADDLWPPTPDSDDESRKLIDSEFEKWIRDAEDLLERMPGDERRLTNLRKKSDSPQSTADATDDAEWHFSDPIEQWHHDNLSELVDGLRSLHDGLLQQVIQRHEFSHTVEEQTLIKPATKWREAISDISDREANPHYGGLQIKPLLGLIPLGRSPESGLWEFAHLQTGSVPVRDDDDHEFEVGPETGIIFVLLPGGEFLMGYQGATEEQYQSLLETAQPAQTVTLDPFFISKYEMTQGQWERITGTNPSFYKAGADKKFQITPAHPVESVSWDECSTVLSHLGCQLPTEAQWEYAARAGTNTPWVTGSDKHSLEGYANLADVSYERQFGKPQWSGWEDWLDDGHAVHAPVGSFRPNQFGLMDMTGNVYEWCRDRFDQRSYRTAEPRAGDGLREPDTGHNLRCSRGGSYVNDAAKALSGARYEDQPPTVFWDQGVRPALPIPR